MTLTFQTPALKMCVCVGGFVLESSTQRFNLSFQAVWTLSQAAATTAASASISAAASARKGGLAKTAPSLAAQMTAPVKGCVLKGSACATVTLEATTVRSRVALRTARAADCASTGSACVRSHSQVKTAWSEGVSTTARTRGCA